MSFTQTAQLARGPYTVAPGVTAQNEHVTQVQQIRGFRNPRGQRYYYLLITTDLGVDLYCSRDGIVWRFISTLSAGNTSYTASLDYYDNGSQMIVYVTYGPNSGYSTGTIYYRRLVIPDTTATPTIGAQQTAVASSNQGVPIIKRDRNGYVHIAYMKRRDKNIKGTVYNYSEPWIVGTTDANPGDVPAGWVIQQIDAHPDVAFSSTGARESLVVFGGAGDIGGVIYAARDAAGVVILRGRDIVSYNGVAYTLGVATTIVASTVTTDTTCSVAFRAVVDTSNYAHFVTERDNVNSLVESFKASAASTVESFAASVTVDNSNNVVNFRGLSLSIDRTVTPNILWAFYIFDAVQTNMVRFRPSPVDTISWGSERTVEDDTVAGLWMMQPVYQREVKGIQAFYARPAAPRLVRMYEILTARRTPHLLKPRGGDSRMRQRFSRRLPLKRA